MVLETSHDGKALTEMYNEDDNSFIDSSEGEAGGKEEEENVGVSKRETKLVWKSRVVFFFFLTGVACVTGVLTYNVSRGVEDKDFETRTIARQLTAQGLHTNTAWPFVQLPMYEAQASEAVEATAATFVFFTPVVQDNEIEQYETFAANNREWIQESLDYNGLDTNVSSLTLIPRVYSVQRNRTFDDMTLPFHLPVAQISSVQFFSAIINGDTGMDLNVDVAYSVMNTTRNAVMSGLRSAGGDAEPGAFLATPVFESYDENAPIVAVVSGFLRWFRNFENLLPSGSEPLILVIRHCNDAISYEIEGPSAKFLGYGDTFHDQKYNHLERNGTFAPYVSSNGCLFTLHIYPTVSFESTYRTSSPAAKTVAIISCYVFTAILFVLFNIVVEYRQKKLESNANKNSALVSSLFPETVRERLVEEYDRKNKPSEELNAFDPTLPTDVALASRPPIADRFDSSSVFFADLVGFTRWSATREPEQVLILLETLYNAFDTIAKRMGVFKVETIGDCYMAVTGVPKTRDDHAVLMVKFARACLTRMSQLLPTLTSSLGESTLDLAMRIGIHSGPVTAGVLRGEKSRFQLFGDTVNTASRMESNGQPGRIHVSESTADEIAKHGKAKWLEPREDKIVAKGKGTMDTFWVNSTRDSSVGTTESFASRDVGPQDQNDTVENYGLDVSMTEATV